MQRLTKYPGVSLRYLCLWGSLVFVTLALSMALLQPALAAPPITGVTVTPATAAIHFGQAVYVRATVQGSGDFDHRVNWSLDPGNAGSVSPTGLFISGPAFTGIATVTATSVESPTFSGAAAITVSDGGGVVHVDHNNAGSENGTALRPYRTIQGAINNAGSGDTIKVAQGTYIESVGLPWLTGALLLGGFKGGSSADYAANLPGDFVTRSTDHETLVTTIQSPDRSTLPAVILENWSPPNALTYAVDGFTLTGGSNGIKAVGKGPIDFFISQNLIKDNGALVAGPEALGGGIWANGLNIVILNNRIANNKSGFGGGILATSGSNSFLVQGNLIENNEGGGDIGGGAAVSQDNQGQGTALFTWNIVRGNRANLLLNYGTGGGLHAGGGPLELSHNTYTDNEAHDVGGGILIADGTLAVMRHELIYKNRTTHDSSGAGIYVQPNAGVTMDHCTVAGNTSPSTEGNGLKVREQTVMQVSNSIIWGNSGDQLYIYPGAAFTMTYSDSQPYPGVGNLSVDPLFAAPATDDYHLKSVRGRWVPALAQWVTDKVHSPCIDKGNPVAAFDQEPVPNRSRANMGVYGNTPEASKSQASFEAVLVFLLEN
jgi:hypothetical protein